MTTIELDEWIIREVIETLHMAMTTLLEITGLDSPQEVAKKSAENDTAITRRIRSAIDIIQQGQRKEQPQGLDEAAEKATEEYVYNDGGPFPHTTGVSFLSGFKAGAEWMAGQGYTQEGIARPDDCEIWVNMTDTE